MTKRGENKGSFIKVDPIFQHVLNLFEIVSGFHSQ